MNFLKIATLVLVSGAAMAQDAPVRFQCEGKLQLESPKTGSEIEPFSIEVKNKAVKLSGLSNLEANFSLIQEDEQYYVFKNARKTQGGNIDRPSGKLYLYVLDKDAHKITLSINGLCTKETNRARF
jgi:hypothetical protein